MADPISQTGVLLSIAARSDPGRLRVRNEDALHVEPSLGILVVADGLGGHPNGDVAAELAVRTVSEHLRPLLVGRQGATAAQPGALTDLAAQAVLAANSAILRAAQDHAHLRGMGATLVLAIATHTLVTVAHVGDCRLYRCRKGYLEGLTQDHNVAEDKVRRNIYTRKEARTSPDRRLVTRALGMPGELQVDTAEVPARRGDVFLLCSDGLTDMLEDDEIAATIDAGYGRLEEVAEALVVSANLHGGRDNISLILARYD